MANQLLILAPLVLLALNSVDGQRYYNHFARSYLGRDLYEHGRSISDNLVTCGPHTCGVGAHCVHGSVRPVCACLPGYSGDALTQCVKIECVDNSECRSHQTCVNQHCVDPCAGTCGVNANCDVRNHIPVCSCPPGYTGNPFSSCRIADPEEACHPSPCGPNTKCHVSNNQAICTCLPGYRGSPLSGCRHECESDGECGATQSCRDFKCVSPCSDCGVNADCETVAAHRAVCKCPRGYHGDPYRICSAECTSDGECPSYKPACIYNACVDPCINACGVNAECHLRGLTPVCSCPRNMTGDPFSFCRPFEARDLCEPNPCGANAKCTPGHDRTGAERPVCTCPVGYIGNALVSCERGECELDSQCADQLACVGYRCVDPCLGNTQCGTGAVCMARRHLAVCTCPNENSECRRNIPICSNNTCGVDAKCDVHHNIPVCSCRPGYTGNPLKLCQIMKPEQLCQPSPCGVNTECHVINNVATCICQPGYKGNPLAGCHHECESDSDCDDHLSCRVFTCVSPCGDCGVNTKCETVEAHRATCKCISGYTGDPYKICKAECTSNTECPSSSPVCMSNACINPCTKFCGINALCQLRNVTAVCSCPRNMTGDPFTHCRPLEPNDVCKPNTCGINAKCTPKRGLDGAEHAVCSCPLGYTGNPLLSCEHGECETHSNCSEQSACLGYRCVDPCKMQCGIGAVCNVRSHHAFCTCPQGLHGNPIVNCYTTPAVVLPVKLNPPRVQPTTTVIQKRVIPLTTKTRQITVLSFGKKR